MAKGTFHGKPAAPLHCTLTVPDHVIKLHTINTMQAANYLGDTALAAHMVAEFGKLLSQLPAPHQHNAPLAFIEVRVPCRGWHLPVCRHLA
jgi:hypothetical protein